MLGGGNIGGGHGVELWGKGGGHGGGHWGSTLGEGEAFAGEGGEC